MYWTKRSLCFSLMPLSCCDVYPSICFHECPRDTTARCHFIWPSNVNHLPTQFIRHVLVVTSWQETVPHLHLSGNELHLHWSRSRGLVTVSAFIEIEIYEKDESFEESQKNPVSHDTYTTIHSKRDVPLTTSTEQADFQISCAKYTHLHLMPFCSLLFIRPGRPKRGTVPTHPIKSWRLAQHRVSRYQDITDILRHR